MTAQSLNLPYLLLAGSIIIAAVLAFTALQPAFLDVQGVQNEIKTTQTILTERETFLRSLDSKLAELEANREHETRLQAVLPNKEQMEDALRILHQSAQANGVEIIDISNNSNEVQSETRSRQARGTQASLPEAVTPLAASINIRASYQSVRAFLTALERAPRLMDVSEITLRRDEQVPDRLNGQLSVRFYMIGENMN